MTTTTEEPPFVLPGEAIDPSLIPTHPKRPLRLGPGLRHIPPSEIVPTVAGRLVVNPTKPSISLDFNGGRYVPEPNDLVIGQVHHSSADFHFVSLAPHTPHALLPVMAFEGATRKTRPSLPAGSLVYARVAHASRHMDAELECVSHATGKADGLGPLSPPANASANANAAATTGTVFSVSLGLARRLLMPRAERDAGLVVLDAIAAEGLAFETAVGRNGRVWVASESVPTLLLVGAALALTDEKDLDMPAQRSLVKKLVREMG